MDASALIVPGSIVVSVSPDSSAEAGPCGWRVTISESMVSVNGSSPAAFKSFGLPDCIFEFWSIQTTCT